MKKQLLLLLFLSISECLSVRKTNKYSFRRKLHKEPVKVCDADLLESYDLQFFPNTKDKNLLCPSVTNNCCSIRNQIKIYKKWVFGHERNNILRVYKDFMDVYDDIFDKFIKIEEYAKNIHNRNPNSSSNCNTFAKGFIGINVALVKEAFIVAARKAFQFLYESRRGFYCSICDADNHEFFHNQKEEFFVSFGFCKKMVGETMNYFNFKYMEYMKLARVYSQFIESCSLMGEFTPNKHLKHTKKFFRQEDIVEEISHCKNNMNTGKAHTACSDFCERFNPARFDKFLEGELGQLYTFNYELGLQIEKEEKIFHEENKKKEIIGTRRLLEEESANSEKKEESDSDDDEDQNEFNDFNQEFNAHIIKPIVYEYKEDLLFSHYVNTNKSLFILDINPDMDISDFRSIVAKDGINFYNYGFSALLNPEGLELLIQNMPKDEEIPHNEEEKKETNEVGKEGNEADNKEEGAEESESGKENENENQTEEKPSQKKKKKLKHKK